MSIRDVSILEFAPRTQEIRLKCHNWNDLKRKFSIINDSRGGCIFNAVFVDDKPQEKYFINFEFFVSLRRSRQYTPPENVYHTGSAPITKFNDKREMLMTRVHPVALKGFTGMLWLRVSKIIGTHDYDSIYTYYTPNTRR